MSDVLYEVTLRVDEDARPDYEPWLTAHIDEVLALPGFTGATWSEGPAQDGRIEYVVTYELRDQEAMERYLAEHAARMREDGIRRFDGRFSASRRILTVRRRSRS